MASPSIASIRSWPMLFGKKEERMFMIYGVKHFDDISAWMKDFMILSADEQF